MKRLYVCEGTRESGEKCLTVLDQGRSPKCDWPGCSEEACQKCGKVFPLPSGDSIRTCWRHAPALQNALNSVMTRRSVKSMITKWCVRTGLYSPTQRNAENQLTIPGAPDSTPEEIVVM